MSSSHRFYKLFIELAQRRDLQSTDKVILAILIDRMGKNGRCWPGVRTVAKDAGVDKNTVAVSIKRLQASGDLWVKDKEGNILSAQNKKRGTRQYYELPDKSVHESRTVKNIKCLRNKDTGVCKTGTEVSEKPGPNQTDQYNQTTSSEVFLTFPTSGKIKTWELTQAKVDEYRQTYPNLDTEAELRKSWQWCMDNPGRRKTARGMPRFLGAWLSRAAKNGKGGGCYDKNEFGYSMDDVRQAFGFETRKPTEQELRMCSDTNDG